MFIQFGKDLTEVRTIIGTGGIFASGREPLLMLKGAPLYREGTSVPETEITGVLCRQSLYPLCHRTLVGEGAG